MNATNLLPEKISVVVPLFNEDESSRFPWRPFRLSQAAMA